MIGKETDKQLRISLGGEMPAEMAEALESLNVREPEISTRIFPGSETLKYVWPTPVANYIEGPLPPYHTFRVTEFGEEAVLKLIAELPIARRESLSKQK